LTRLTITFSDTTYTMDWTDQTIPAFSQGGLSVFPSVVSLGLSKDCLSKSLFDNCPSCLSLDLSNTNLDKVPSVVNHLTQLSSLDMSSNCISSLNGLFLEFENLSKITSLVLTDNNLENLEGVEMLVMLQILDVSDNKIHEAQEIGRLAKLMHISEIIIRGNPLTELVFILFH
jgi:Leucine-rich repeat (LRR) protein